MRLLSITALFISFSALIPNSFSATAPLQESLSKTKLITNSLLLLIELTHASRAQMYSQNTSAIGNTA